MRPRPLEELEVKAGPTPGIDSLPAYGYAGGGLRLGGLLSDEQLVRAFRENPVASVKFWRLCDALAGLDWQVQAKRRGDAEPVPLPDEYPLAQLLREPNPVFDDYDLLFLSELYVRTTGEVYWRLVRSPLTRRPLAIYVYPRFWVAPGQRDPAGRVLTYRVQAQGARLREEVLAEDLLAFRIPDPLDPYLRGLGQMLAFATEIRSYEYASESDARLMEQDATPPGALVLPPNAATDATSRRQMREEWRRNYGGLANRGEVAVLWGGVDFRQFRLSRADLQHVESQEHLKRTILLGVHPHIVGIAEDVNRANAEAAEFTFARWEIWPRARWWQRKITRHVARLFDPRAALAFLNVIPQDAARLAKEALEATAGEVLTRDDRRRRLGEAPLGPERGGDALVLRLQTIEREPGPVEPPARPQGEGRGDRDRLTAEDLQAFRRAIAALDRAGRAGAPGGDGTLRPRGAGAPHPSPARKQDEPPTLDEVLAALPDPDDEFRRVFAGLEPEYVRTWEARVEDASAEVGVEIALGADHPAFVAYLRTQAGSRIREANETTFRRTLEAIRGALAEGGGRGESLNAIGRAIGEVFTAARGARALLIARTEVLDASNAAAVEAYRASGVVEGLDWLLAPDYTRDVDDGVCEDVAATGPVLLGQLFGEGVLAQGIAHPPAHAACRCTVAPVLAGGRRMYDDEVVRKARIDALGREHDRLERLFAAAWKRAMQAQQRRFQEAVRRLAA